MTDTPLRPTPAHDDPPPTAATGARADSARGSSVWLVAQRSLASQRRGRYVAASTAHPGRMAPDLAAYAIGTYTEPGGLVLDPMCGIGTTLVEAIHAGRPAYGVEYEPRWTQIARDNIALAISQKGTGTATVHAGDARRLTDHVPADLIGQVALVLASPPYGPTGHGRVQVPDGRAAPVLSHQHEAYGDRRDRRNLAHTDLHTLSESLTEILRGCVRLLSPQGTIVLTARPWRRQGELIDLPSLIIDAAEHAGLAHIDRCVALLAGFHSDRLISRPSFHQLLHLRRARARGKTLQLVAHEDVLVFQALDLPASGPASAPAENSHMRRSASDDGNRRTDSRGE